MTSVSKACGLVFLAIMFATPAWGAIVRGRPARSRRAICAEAGLRRADAQFDRNYARLLERLDLQQRRRLIETQRRWLKQREACADQEAVACVADAIRKREKEIAQAFSDGYDFGSVRLCCTGQTLRLGSKTLGVVAPTDGSDVVPLRLLYENRTVLEIFGWLEIDGRGGGGSAEAVVVSTHGYGTAGCSDQYHLGPREPGAARGAAGGRRRSVLAHLCGPTKREWVDADQGGVAWIRRQCPDLDAGRGRNRAAPAGIRAPARNQDDRLQAHTTPTDNEEFFEALRFAAPNDWRLLAAAFEHACTRQDGTGGTPVVLTTCADFPRACLYAQVFAACVSGSCFFAREWRDDATKKTEVAYYPARDQWPNAVAEIVDRWRNGEMREHVEQR
jgi:uncharacterized protein